MNEDNEKYNDMIEKIMNLQTDIEKHKRGSDDKSSEEDRLLSVAMHCTNKLWSALGAAKFDNHMSKMK